MRRIQVTFTEEQHAALKRLSAERGVSISALVREAIDLFVKPRLWDLQRLEREALERDGGTG